MASLTRAAVSGRTHRSPWTTRATVLKLTLAIVATSRIVGRASRFGDPGRFLGSRFADTDDSWWRAARPLAAMVHGGTRQRCQVLHQAHRCTGPGISTRR